MSRVSDNEYDAQGLLVNGYDYEHQAWVRHSRYVRCGHVNDCMCYGRLWMDIRVQDAN